MKNKSMDKLFEVLREKGAIFILMGVAIIYFHTQNESLSLKVDKMHIDNTNQARIDRREMLDIISNNTFVMKAIQKQLEKNRYEK